VVPLLPEIRSPPRGTEGSRRAIHLMYCHARLDRAPDHVFCSVAARKRHNQIRLALVEHPLIAQWRRQPFKDWHPHRSRRPNS
jgi:hypothetical protein